MSTGPDDLDEGVLQQLADYDLYIIVDDSAAQKDYWSDFPNYLIALPELHDYSSQSRTPPPPRSQLPSYSSYSANHYIHMHLLHQTTRILSELVKRAIKYDDDGVDICFLSDHVNPGFTRKVLSDDDIDDLIAEKQPALTLRHSPTAKVLESLILKYKSTLTTSPSNVKPRSFMVLSANTATDDLPRLISKTAKWLDAGDYPSTQLGIQFVQIGGKPSVTRELKALDDALAVQRDCRDIVDTTICGSGNLSNKVVLKAFLGAINGLWDRK